VALLLESPAAGKKSPTDRITQILACLHGVKRAGNGWEARCPAHEDREPSLSVTQVEDRVLVYCHAGCSYDAVLKALGLKKSDLFVHSVVSSPPSHKSIMAIYDYTDADERLLFQVVRYTPKSFQQRRPGGDGKWIYNLQGVQPVLFHLPRLRNAVARKECVYLVEGEKDVLALETLGLTATTAPMGAGKWRPAYTESLREAQVIILPDNDAPGKAHANAVAAAVAGVAASVSLVHLPNLPVKGDVSDWIAQGHTREELGDLAASAADWQPGEAVAADRFALTDLGNAERLISRHGQDLHFHVDAGQWLHWNGALWKMDNTGAINRLACSVVRSIAKEADKLPAGEERESLFKHMLKSESAPRLAAMVELARYQPGVPVKAGKLDGNTWALNVQNGTVDLHAGTLHPHQRADLLTKSSPVSYDPAATCPRWEQFLREVFCEEEELIRYVQRFAGYCLTGDTREQNLVFMVGKGANGKSVLLETLRSLLGEYAQDTSFATFLDKRDTSTSDLAGLVGARMVTASEGDGATAFNEALLKRLTGGDAITCRYLYREFFSYTPTFKIVFATNEVPRLTSQGYAMRRRVHILPFTRTFYPAGDGKCPVRDVHLREALRAELPGILAWAVRGCLDWQRDGLTPPARIVEETRELFESFDPLADFLAEACVILPSAKVESGALWLKYQTWCEEHGRQPAFRQPQVFSRNLGQREGITPARRHGGRYLIGVGLKA